MASRVGGRLKLPTVTVKRCVDVRLGVAPSDAITLMMLAEEAWEAVGVHVKSPPAVMAAPSGAPGPRLKATVCAGMSGSRNVTPKTRTLPTLAVRSAIGSNSGGRLTSVTITVTPREAVRAG